MSDSTPKKHWNGTVGDRHEHQNVWMRGGVRAPAPISPWAGIEVSKRRDSDASAKSNGSIASVWSPPPLFSGLASQKRNTTDPSAHARRQSYNEQATRPSGLVSSWWNGYVKGR